MGQYLETTMLCSNAYVVSEDFFDYDGKESTAKHDENGVSALYRLYPASEGWVFLAAPLESDWEAVRVALELGDDPRFSSSQDRAAHDSELAQVIGAVLSGRSAEEWEAALSAQDVTCVEVSRGSFSEFTISSETVRANEFVAEVVHPLFGTHLRHGAVARFSVTPASPRPACLVGQHTRSVLLELGYTDDQIADLQARGVVHCLEEA